MATRIRRSYKQWEADLTTIGTRRWTSQTYYDAVEGYYPCGDLGTASQTDTPLANLDDNLRYEAALLADARTLTRPYRSAQYSTANRGYLVAPYDNTPIEEGLLGALIEQADSYANAHPDRAHMAELVTELEILEIHWHAMLSGDANFAPVTETDRANSAAARAEAEHGWATLEGTERQIRWAQTLRYQMCAHAEPGSELDEQARTNTAALYWIITNQELNYS